MGKIRTVGQGKPSIEHRAKTQVLAQDGAPL